MTDEFAIYLRKSRADVELEKIEKFETLEKHKKQLTELATKQNLKIGRIYQEVVSGETIAARPIMQELIDDVYDGKWKGVIVMEVERLARGDTKDQGTVADAFKFSNTLIVTPLKTYDPNNEYDEEYFEFGLFMSRREYKTIRRRMQRGLIASVKEGNYLGSIAPYGYEKVQLDRKTKTLKIKEDEAKVVVMIFEWFVYEDLSIGQIVKKLYAMNIPTRTGSREWNRGTLHDILTNITYTGKLAWNKRKVKKELDGDRGIVLKKRRLSNDEKMIVDGKHPAIISMELFEKAQKKFTGSIPVNINNEIIFPLAGLLVCKNCGKTMIYQSYKKRPTTAPRVLHPESQTCKMKSVEYSQILEALIQSLESFIENFEFKMTNEYEIERRKKQKALIQTMQNEMNNLEKSRIKLFDFLERGIYNEQDFVSRKTLIEEKIKTLQNQINKERNNITDDVDYEEKIYTFKNIINTLRNDELPAKHKSILLKEIVDKIEIQTFDMGRGKGAKIKLDVFIK